MRSGPTVSSSQRSGSSRSSGIDAGKPLATRRIELRREIREVDPVRRPPSRARTSRRARRARRPCRGQHRTGMRVRARPAAGRTSRRANAHVGVQEQDRRTRARAAAAASRRSPCRRGGCTAPSPRAVADGRSAGSRRRHRSPRSGAPRAAAKARRSRSARPSATRSVQADDQLERHGSSAGPAACQLAHAASSVRPSAGSSVRQGTASVMHGHAHAGALRQARTTRP